MIAVALCWSAFTLLVVSAQPLAMLQLATVWGTVGLLTLIFKKLKRAGTKPARDRQGARPSASLAASTLATAPTSTAAPRTTEAAVERVINDLLSAPALTDDTRIDLNSFLLQLRAGRLQALDETYVRDLHRRLLSPAANQPDIGIDDGQDVAAENGRSSAPVDLFATIQRITAAGGEAINQWDRFVDQQLEKQKANAEIDLQLHLLRTSIKLVLESLDTVQRLRDDPNFAKHYRELELVLRKNKTMAAQREPLIGLTLQPVHQDRLPPQAIEERRGWLEDTLAKVEEVATVVDREAALMAELDEMLATPIAAFVAQQRHLLRQHLSSLSSVTISPEPIRTRSASLGVMEPNLAPLNRSLPAATTLLETSAYKADESSLVGAGGPQSTVAAIARQRNIPHLVHFTRCENLPSIFRHGLMSVLASSRNGLSVTRNDVSRWDGQLDGTSLSIAFPNHSMFFKYRQLSPGADWAVLLIAPQVLWEKDCAFYPKNAADGQMIRRPRDEMKSAEAFSDMFADGEGRFASLRSCDPTDVQAEVMVYEVVEPHLLDAVAFETPAARDRYRHLLEGRDSICAGAGKGMFAARH